MSVFFNGLQALADLCGQADAQPLPREALQRAARWLSTALEARCGGHAAPAAGAAAARQFCALLRALAAVLSEVRRPSHNAPKDHADAWVLHTSSRYSQSGSRAVWGGRTANAAR